jgi:hypothetical protein
MSTVTLLDEIADLERLLARAPAALSVSARVGDGVRAAVDDDEDEGDLFGEDDLGFDDVDEVDDEEVDEDDVEDDELDEDVDDDR